MTTETKPLEDSTTSEVFDSLREREGEAPEQGPTDTPPDRERSRKAKRQRATSARKASPTRKATDKQIREQLEGTIGAIGATLVPFDPWCGVTILEGAGTLTDSLIEVSKSNPAVRRTLESFVVTSTWGTFLGAVGALVVPIMAHHSSAIPGSLGVAMGPDRDTLAKAVGDDPDRADRIILEVAQGRKARGPKPDPVKPTAPASVPDLPAMPPFPSDED